MYAIPTIKVVAQPSADNPLGYIVINKSDFNREVHQPYDDGTDVGADNEHVPTMAELLAARDQLQARARELDAERDRLAEQAAANDAEAQRLADLAAAAAPAVPPEIAAMTKEQLQAALTEKGISFPAAANKAELIALLTA